jgi:hypothetical protein
LLGFASKPEPLNSYSPADSTSATLQPAAFYARQLPLSYIWRNKKSCKVVAKGGSGLLEIEASQIDLAARVGFLSPEYTLSFLPS